MGSTKIHQLAGFIAYSLASAVLLDAAALNKRDGGVCTEIFAGCPTTFVFGGNTYNFQSSPADPDYLLYKCDYTTSDQTLACNYQIDGTSSDPGCPMAQGTFTCPTNSVALADCATRGTDAKFIQTCYPYPVIGMYLVECNYQCLFSGTGDGDTCYFSIPDGGFNVEYGEGGCSTGPDKPTPSGYTAGRRRRWPALPVREAPVHDHEHHPAGPVPIMKFGRQ